MKKLDVAKILAYPNDFPNRFLLAFALTVFEDYVNVVSDEQFEKRFGRLGKETLKEFIKCQ